MAKKYPTAADLAHANKVQAQVIDELKAVVSKIASMGKGMKPEIIDWQNIGKMATRAAREYLQPKCRTCGQPVAETTQHDSDLRK